MVESVHQRHYALVQAAFKPTPASSSMRILESSCDAVGFQPHASQVVLWGDSRHAKRRTSGFTTNAGNFHHFKTPVIYLESLILIDEPTFGHPNLEVVWLNSRVFLLICLLINLFLKWSVCINLFSKARSSPKEIPYANSFPGTSPSHVYEYSRNLTPVHLCNLQYSVLATHCLVPDSMSFS